MYEDDYNLAQQYAMKAQEEVAKTAAPVYVAQDSSATVFEEEPEVSSTRGEAWSDLLTCLTSPALRIGFLTQFTVLAFGFAFFYGNGGHGLFTFDLYSIPEHLRISDKYTLIMILLESAFLCGCICIACFQIYVADNSK